MLSHQMPQENYKGSIVCPLGRTQARGRILLHPAPTLPPPRPHPLVSFGNSLTLGLWILQGVTGKTLTDKRDKGRWREPEDSS